MHIKVSLGLSLVSVDETKVRPNISRAGVIYYMICIVYVKLSRWVCNIVNRKYCLYNVLLLSRVHIRTL